MARAVAAAREVGLTQSLHFAELSMRLCFGRAPDGRSAVGSGKAQVCHFWHRHRPQDGALSCLSRGALRLAGALPPAACAGLCCPITGVRGLAERLAAPLGAGFYRGVSRCSRGHLPARPVLRASVLPGVPCEQKRCN